MQPPETNIPLAAEVQATNTASSEAQDAANTEPVQAVTLAPSKALPPSALPNTPTATLESYRTKTPIPADAMWGTFQHTTTADGLCSDSPRFLYDGGYVGGEGSIFCVYKYETGEWEIRTVPTGARVNVVHPGTSGLFVGTSRGLCEYSSWLAPKPGEFVWVCPPQHSTPPVDNILGLDEYSGKFLYMLPDSIVYNDQIYRIPDIVGDPDAVPTQITFSKIYKPEFEIWVGTNGFGIVVIQPFQGELKRLTTRDGLPSNFIRDIAGEHCPGDCSFQDVWIATNAGIGRWNGREWQQFTTSDGLPSNNIQKILWRQKDAIWALIDNSLVYYDGQAWQIFGPEYGVPAVEFTGIAGDSHRLWLSTNGDGLYIFSIQPGLP